MSEKKEKEEYYSKYSKNKDMYDSWWDAISDINLKQQKIMNEPIIKKKDIILINNKLIDCREWSECFKLKNPLECFDKLDKDVYLNCSFRYYRS